MTTKVLAPTCGHDGAVLREVGGALILCCGYCAYYQMCNEATVKSFLRVDRDKSHDIEAKLHNLVCSLRRRGLKIGRASCRERV